ncbi:MAG: anhydro-N-acetylmuramic acid kinase [Bacteroidales bacterium]|nr:anhydro-N-acetylmuramic acid kinase [Bacteroidales bacterium]
MKEYRILGLMSGTSLDGVDLAGCRFIKEKEKWNYEIDCAETIPYPDEWRLKLTGSMDETAAGLARLHMEYGRYLGELSRQFIGKYRLRPDYISSHGHTVFHRPEEGMTFQLGSGAAISAVSGLPVICDFRSGDVALGGQGAPLVPVGDALLFPEYDFCLNIGGIANVSFNDIHGNRVAYDICPANMVLNRLALEAGKWFDKDGDKAREGETNVSLMNELNKIGFYRLHPPKTLGKEYISKHFFPLIDRPGLSLTCRLRTFTEHIAQRIGLAIKDHPHGKALVTGGGAKNKFLIERLNENTPCRIEIPDEELVDFREALIFAFLGALRIENIPNSLKSVSGALRDNTGGTVYSV